MASLDSFRMGTPTRHPRAPAATAAPNDAYAPMGGGGIETSTSFASHSIKSMYESRLRAVVGQLRETLLRVQHDAPLAALAADKSTAEFVPARIEEVLEAALAHEREASISRLAETLAVREGELRVATRAAASASAALQDGNAAHAAEVTALHARVETLTHALTREREAAHAHAETAASALAAANAAREQASNLAQQRAMNTSDLSSSLTTAEAAVAAQSLHISQLESRLAAHTHDTERHMREIATLHAAVAAAVAETAAVADREAAANVTLEQLRRALTDTQQRGDALEAEAGRVRGEMDALQAANEAANARLHSMSAALTHATHNVAACSARADASSARVEALTAKLADAQSAANESAQVIDSLESRLATSNATCDTAVNDAREYAQALVRTVEEKNAAVAAANESRLEAQRVRDAAQQQAHDAQQSITTLQSELQASEQRCRALQADCSAANERGDSLAAELHASQETCTALAAHTDALRAQLEVVSASEATATDALTTTRSLLTDRDVALTAAQHDSERLQSCVRDVTAHLQALLNAYTHERGGETAAETGIPSACETATRTAQAVKRLMHDTADKLSAAEHAREAAIARATRAESESRESLETLASLRDRTAALTAEVHSLSHALDDAHIAERALTAGQDDAAAAGQRLQLELSEAYAALDAANAARSDAETTSQQALAAASRASAAANSAQAYLNSLTRILSHALTQPSDESDHAGDDTFMTAVSTTRDSTDARTALAAVMTTLTRACSAAGREIAAATARVHAPEGMMKHGASGQDETLDTADSVSIGHDVTLPHSDNVDDLDHAVAAVARALSALSVTASEAKRLRAGDRLEAARGHDHAAATISQAQAELIAAASHSSIPDAPAIALAARIRDVFAAHAVEVQELKAVAAATAAAHEVQVQSLSSQVQDAARQCEALRGDAHSLTLALSDAHATIQRLEVALQAASTRSAELDAVVEACNARVAAAEAAKQTQEAAATKAAGRVRALRREILTLARDADARMLEERTAREAAEKGREAAEQVSERARARARVLADALEAATVSLRAYEAKRAHGSAAVSDLKSLLSSSLHTLSQSRAEDGDASALDATQPHDVSSRLDALTQRLATYVSEGQSRGRARSRSHKSDDSRLTSGSSGGGGSVSTVSRGEGGVMAAEMQGGADQEAVAAVTVAAATDVAVVAASPSAAIRGFLRGIPAEQ